MSDSERTIREKEMVISEIEKKWNVPTARAVKLFCDAFRVSKPNTDYLDQWAKRIIQKKRIQKPFVEKPTIDDCCSDSCDSDCGSCGSCGH